MHNTKKVQHEKSAKPKKCDLKRVQHEATREKMQHKKNARVKNAKKSVIDNGRSADGPLYTGSELWV